MMHALAIIGAAAGILIFSIGAARFILDWAERRRQFNDARRETESLTAMLAGDRRQADAMGQVCPWPRAE